MKIKVDLSNFAAKVDLKSLKSKVDQLNFDKLVPVPVDLSKLSDVLKNDIANKNVFYPKIKNIEDKIGNITNLDINTSLYSKI